MDYKSPIKDIQLVAGFTPARTGGREVMWRERAVALRVVKKVDLYVILSESLSGLHIKLT
jgi:hypothetical protein